MPPLLEPCPACRKPVSVTVYRCPGCGHLIRKPTRSTIGYAVLWLFALFNVGIVLFTLLVMLLTSGGEVVDQEANARGMATFLGAVVATWIAGNLVLGLFVSLTRPRES